LQQKIRRAPGEGIMPTLQPTADEVAAACAALGFGPEPGGPESGRTAGPVVDRARAELLAAYLGLLVKWNKAMNLVGHGHWRRIFDDLAADSLHLAAFLKELGVAGAGGTEVGAGPLTLDLGAGAGLPGIPLRIVWPAGIYRMVEMRAKRASFLRTALARLRLARTEVFEGRAEDALARAGSADLIVSRAFMPWERVLELVAGYVADRGRVLFLANEPAPGEQAVAGPWRLEAERPYAAAGRTRYFWSFMPTMAPR
jgi:16S rRNA (guanine527-N7)-methyltransferase